MAWAWRALRYRLVNPDQLAGRRTPGPTKKEGTFGLRKGPADAGGRLGRSGQRGDIPKRGRIGGPACDVFPQRRFRGHGGLDLRNRDAAAFTASRPTRPLSPTSRTCRCRCFPARRGRRARSADGIRPCRRVRRPLPTRGGPRPRVSTSSPRSSLPRLLGGPLSSSCPATRKWRWHRYRSALGRRRTPATGDGASRDRPRTPDSRTCCTRSFGSVPTAGLGALHADAELLDHLDDAVQVGAPAARTGPIMLREGRSIA